MPEVWQEAKRVLSIAERRAQRTERNRRWRLANPERVTAENMRCRQRYQAPDSPQRAKALIRSKRYREKRTVRAKIYHAENKDVINARRRQRFALCRDECIALGNIRRARRRARKAGASLNDLTLAQWREIQAAYGFRCVYCGRKTQRLTQDHITPLIAGGSHTASNIVPACRPCNSKKGRGAVLSPVQPLLLTVAPAKKLVP